MGKELKLNEFHTLYVTWKQGIPWFDHLLLGLLVWIERWVISNRIQDNLDTEIEKFFQLAFAQGIPLLPALGELVRETKFLIEQEREVAIEIAPARATLTLLTYFPALILGGAFLTKIIHFDRGFFAPIPITMMLISITLQMIGRRWSERIINNVRE